MPARITILDGAMGTELARRGIDTSGPEWSARALLEDPGAVAAIHAAYAEAGATVHIANTFRTRQRDLERSAPPAADPDAVAPDWRTLTRRAIDIARVSVPASHTLAASLAPLEDCYEPDRSPGEAGRAAHRAFAEALVEAGADLILCETFPHPGEACVAVEESVAAASRRGIPVWCSLTPGPRAALMSPETLARAAREAAERGVAAALVNCVAASRALPYVEALASALADRLPIGIYANAGEDREGIGWGDVGEEGPRRYAELAQTWADAGATIIGGCCGTGPTHVRALAERFRS